MHYHQLKHPKNTFLRALMPLAAVLLFLNTGMVQDSWAAPETAASSPFSEKALEEARSPQQAAPAESPAKGETIEVPAKDVNPLADQPNGPTLMQEGFKTIGMLIFLLVGFWWFSNWLKKSGKLARIAGSNGGIEVLSAYSVGQKEKIALIRVQNEEILVGITQHSIQTLHHFYSHKDKDVGREASFANVMDNVEKTNLEKPAK